MCKSNVVQNRKEYYNSFRDTHYKRLAQNLHDVRMPSYSTITPKARLQLERRGFRRPKTLVSQKAVIGCYQNEFYKCYLQSHLLTGLCDCSKREFLPTPKVHIGSLTGL